MKKGRKKAEKTSEVELQRLYEEIKSSDETYKRAVDKYVQAIKKYSMEELMKVSSVHREIASKLLRYGEDVVGSLPPSFGTKVPKDMKLWGSTEKGKKATQHPESISDDNNKVGAEDDAVGSETPSVGGHINSEVVGKKPEEKAPETNELTVNGVDNNGTESQETPMCEWVGKCSDGCNAKVSVTSPVGWGKILCLVTDNQGNLQQVEGPCPKCTTALVKGTMIHGYNSDIKKNCPLVKGVLGTTGCTSCVEILEAVTEHELPGSINLQIGKQGYFFQQKMDDAVGNETPSVGGHSNSEVVRKKLEEKATETKELTVNGVDNNGTEGEETSMCEWMGKCNDGCNTSVTITSPVGYGEILCLETDEKGFLRQADGECNACKTALAEGTMDEYNPTIKKACPTGLDKHGITACTSCVQIINEELNPGKDIDMQVGRRGFLFQERNDSVKE